MLGRVFATPTKHIRNKVGPSTFYRSLGPHSIHPLSEGHYSVFKTFGYESFTISCRRIRRGFPGRGRELSDVKLAEYKCIASESSRPVSLLYYIILYTRIINIKVVIIKQHGLVYNISELSAETPTINIERTYRADEENSGN